MARRLNRWKSFPKAEDSQLNCNTGRYRYLEDRQARNQILIVPRERRLFCSKVSDVWNLVTSSFVTTRFAANGPDSFFDNDWNHHQCGNRISPPPTQERIEKKSSQENC